MPGPAALECGVTVISGHGDEEVMFPGPVISGYLTRSIPKSILSNNVITGPKILSN